MEKRERGSKIVFLILLRLLGRISSGKRPGKRMEILGKKIKILKTGDEERYEVAYNFMHPPA